MRHKFTLGYNFVPPATIANFRVALKPSAALVFLILFLTSAVSLGWSGGFMAAGTIVASILLHECGHAGVARLCGVRVRTIGLSWKGGYTIRECSPRLAAETLTTLAGPCVNLALYLLFRHVTGKTGSWISLANLVLLVSNLVPLPPTDGLRLWRLLGKLAGGATGAIQPCVSNSVPLVETPASERGAQDEGFSARSAASPPSRTRATDP
jgi:Zn-dependent protease